LAARVDREALRVVAVPAGDSAVRREAAVLADAEAALAVPAAAGDKDKDKAKAGPARSSAIAAGPARSMAWCS